MKDKGLRFEKEVFGCDSSRRIRVNAHVSFMEGVQWVKEMQSSYYQWDPRHPSTKLTRLLFERVREELPQHVRNELGLYVALGTMLDLSFGTDAFFQVDGAFLVIAPIDLKTGKSYEKKKRRNDGTDSIIVHKDDFFDENRLSGKTHLIVDRLKRIDPRLDGRPWPFSIRSVILSLIERERKFIQWRNVGRWEALDPDMPCPEFAG